VPVGHVNQIRRYPVKSLQGEALRRAQVDARGLTGDRQWTVRNHAGKFGSGKNTKRFVRIDGLSRLRARYDDEAAIIMLPDGREHPAGTREADVEISRLFGQPLHLATEGDVSHFDDGPVHLVTTSSVAALAADSGVAFDWRRTRANLLITTSELTGFAEDEWLGRRLRLGEQVVLTIEMRMPRCVMVNLPQEELPADGRMLKAVTAANDATLGVLGTVKRAGTVRIGDAVDLI